MKLNVTGLTKCFDGKPVLNGLTFAADERQITCIMAPSGEGKTTLLRILLGLEQPDSGRVELPAKCRWAAVFQEDRLLEHLDAWGNLRFVLGGALDTEKGHTLLEELGLLDDADKPVRDWSGGMKRRLALIRALLVPSDALVLDEPFTGLDAENRAKCIDCIRRETAGKPVLLVTHEETDVQALNGKCLLLN